MLALDPTILELSLYTLKVTGLKSGAYLLKIDNVASGKFTATELESGVNLTALPDDGQKANPITMQGRAILNAVSVKEGLVNGWRGLSKKANAPGAEAALKEQLAKMTEQVQQADEKIRTAATPKKRRFVLAPAE